MVFSFLRDVPIGEGKEVEARATAAGLQAFTEPYREDGVDEVIVEAEDEANLFDESLVVQAMGETQYSEVQVFVPIAVGSAVDPRWRRG